MLVLAMEFSRGMAVVPPQHGRVRRPQRAVDGSPATAGAPTSPKETEGPKARRSLKTEQRCPTILAAPHGRPMVYDREMLGQPTNQ
jgi:hypothetical protein